MEQSEIILEELFSENQLSAKTSQDLSKIGQSQSLLEDMLSETFITALISWFQKLENLQLNLKERFKTWIFQSINSLDQELVLLCSIMTAQLPISLILASNMPFKETIHFTWPPKIPSWKNMMVDLKIFSKIFMIRNTNKNSKLKKFGMNIDSLMIWLLKLLRDKEDMFGHVKTMMVMSNLILSLKVLLFYLWLGYGSLGLMTSVLFTPDGAI